MEDERMNRWQDRRVLVVGLGVEGVALARYFAARGAAVTVNDARPAEALAARLAELAGVPFTLAPGGHDPALAAAADAVYASQGVPLDLPLLVEARRRGVPAGSITTLFYEICRGRVLGITGSAGKTTTTALTAAIVAASGRPHVLTGNIGVWPLAELEQVSPETLVVAEISHTQLQLTTSSPAIACVTNVTPNHLDQFDWPAYVDLKRNHIRHQRPDDIAVLNADDPVGAGFAADTPARVRWFSLSALPDGADGALLRDGWVVARTDGSETRVLPAAEIPLRGQHNVANVLAATALATAAGIDTEVIAQTVRDFQGVPHRLEVVATVNGVTWVNDSIATAPERTLAGMAAFSEPLVLLLGGRDKNLPLEELARAAAERCRAVVTFGEAGDLFAAGMRAAWGAGGPPLQRMGSVDEAVAEAARHAQAGDVVLFSPAGTSFDAYPNFERRGEAFRRLVYERQGDGTRSPERHVRSL